VKIRTVLIRDLAALALLIAVLAALLFL